MNAENPTARLLDLTAALGIDPEKLAAQFDMLLGDPDANALATAYALRTGYMDTRTHTDPRGRVHTTPVVTPKGLAYLAEIKAKQRT